MDDERNCLAWVERVVRRDLRLEWVGGWADGAAALTRLPGAAVDVLVLDLEMPAMPGAEVAQQLRKLCPQTRILAHSAHDEDGYVRRAFAAGVTGYLWKPVPAAELRRTIWETGQGRRVLSSAILETVVIHYGDPVTQTAKRFHLTDRECEVLQFAAAGSLNKEIAAKLNLSEHTVHEHLKHCYAKLGVKCRAEAIGRLGLV